MTKQSVVRGNGFKNLEGQQFGNLTVLEYAGRLAGKRGKKKRTSWLCVCECGKETTVWATALMQGTTTSCGCKRGEALRKHDSTTHGETVGGRPTTEYKTWQSIKYRCHKAGSRDYEKYGAKGIYVCERWLESFDNFFADMGRKPSPEHSLERLDVYGPYSPENCEWQTQDVQARNRTNTKWLEYDGKRMCAKDWADHLGISYPTLQARLRRGWSVERALSVTPEPRLQMLEYNGESKSMGEWADEYGISYDLLKGRLHKGWSLEKSLITPHRSEKGKKTGAK